MRERPRRQVASRSIFVGRGAEALALDPSPVPWLGLRAPSEAYLPDSRKSPRQSQPEGPWVREGRRTPHPAGWAAHGMGRFSPAEVIGATCGRRSGRPRVGNLAACVHTSYNFRHESISPSTFSQLVARRIPAPVRNLVSCVHAGRDIRHGGRLRPPKVRKSAPRVHAGRGSRHGLVRVERFPCWPGVSHSPKSESPSRVYTRDGISGTCPDGQLAAKAYAQGRGPPARSYGHLPAKEGWSPGRRRQAPTPRGDTTPIVRPLVFPERFSLHARQPGWNFNVRMGRGTLDDQGEEKGHPRDGVTLGPCPPLVDPLSTIGSSINARTIATTRPHNHFCDGPSALLKFGHNIAAGRCVE